MAIIYKSNGIKDRNVVIEHLRKKKKEIPDFKVLDIGGIFNPWCEEFVDAYVDVIDDKDKNVILGDINNESTWEKIQSTNWDFVICTHTLEDIRDPSFVIEKINCTFNSGFISMPNKHTELSRIESRKYLGFCHHRWIFQINENDELRAISKFHIIYQLQRKNILEKLYLGLKYLNRKYIRRKAARLYPEIKWVNKKIANNKCELAFIWEENFAFNIINNDFAGFSCHELANFFVKDLANGL